MPYKAESMLVATGMDAPADMTTELCFNPPNGPFGDDNVVTGTIGMGDEDWIVIELSEGKEYTIKVEGVDHTPSNTDDEGALNDSVLKLMDGKGNLIMMNDDITPAGTADTGDDATNLNSRIKFTPEAGSGTQKYYLSVSAYTGNPFADNTGGYQVSVTEVAVLPAGEGADIEGTANADKLVGTDASESIAGLAGNDTIAGASGDDELDGGPGNDLLIGGKGGDSLKGGPDSDTISYQGSAMGVTINLRDGTARGGDAEGDKLGADIENVIGTMYDDVITGTDSVQDGNSLWGMGGMDRLYGGEGDDNLYGGAGDDMLNGGDENDLLVGGPGADVLTGGRGADTASYTGSMMGVTVRLHASQAMGGDAEGDTWGDTTTASYTTQDEDGENVQMTETVPDIIHITGSAMADILAGDSRDNTIMGGGGDDRLYGGPGGGNDTMHGDAGHDHVFGGKGDDVLRGGTGNDHLWGNGGTNTYHGGPGSDTIHANREDVAATRANAAGAVNGYGSVAGETTGTPDEGRTDMDTLSFANFTDQALEDGRGITLDLEGNTIVVNIDSLIGTEEDDVLTGTNAAPETIEGADGGDELVGGTADGVSDTVSYRSSDRAVRVELGDGAASTPSGGHASGDTISGFENAIGSAHGDDLTAHTGGSMLWGLDGDDELSGGVGSDTIIGGAGADEVDGGTSTDSAESDTDNGADTMPDTLSYAGSDAGVTVNLATLAASGGHAEGDEIEVEKDAFDPDGEEGDKDPVDVATFENLTGSDHDDRLTGDHRVNVLAGGKGNDTLSGGAGGDHLVGGEGADMLDGGEDAGEKDNMVPDPNDNYTSDGTDTIAASEDWAVYRAARAAVTVDMSTSTGTAGEAEGDTLKNIELVWGSKDYSDTFIAGPGRDIFHGDGQEATNPAGDTVSYEASKHGVTVNLGSTTDVHNSAGYNSSDPDSDTNGPSTWERPSGNISATDGDGLETNDKSYAYGDILGGIENLTGSSLKDTLSGDDGANALKGRGGNDTLNGAGGADKLYGEVGIDTLNGGAGDDMLWGGAGNDTLDGGADDDTINGGAGDDELSGGDGNDTFVFAPGDGNDIIEDFTSGDMINLKAFGIGKDSQDEVDLLSAISVRAGNVIINLEEYGGGRITLQVTGADPDTVLDALGVDENDDGKIVVDDDDPTMADVFIL